ncbi:reverse transcriptase, partial [Phytophthora megakarya]
MIDNSLYGFTRIPKMTGDLERLDVFEAGEPEDPGKPSMLGRRFYIDDILVPAANWDQLCDGVEDLLEACNKWTLSISVVKIFWGMEYLGHKVSHDGLEANPKDLSALTDLDRFIEDYAIYASVLYELREIDYAAMEKGMNRSRIQLALASESPDPDILTKDPKSPQGSDPSPRGPDPELSDQDPDLASRDPTPACVKTSNPENDDLADLDPRWIHAHRSFKMLKEKIAKTAILRHFDPDRQAVVIVYASDWAISGSLMQEYDQVYYPGMFASRTLKSNELNYGIAEKEVLALFRILDLNYNTLILEIVKCNKGEDEILGTLAASITPRSEVDKALISIAPKKEPRRKVQAPIPTVRSDED